MSTEQTATTVKDKIAPWIGLGVIVFLIWGCCHLENKYETRPKKARTFYLRAQDNYAAGDFKNYITDLGLAIDYGYPCEEERTAAIMEWNRRAAEFDLINQKRDEAIQQGIIYRSNNQQYPYRQY